MHLPMNLTELNDALLKLPQAKIAKVLSIVLLCYIAYLSAQVTWQVFPQARQTSSAGIAKVLTKPSTTKNAVNIQSLQSLNLFGSYTEQIEDKKVEVQDAPETKLRLTLSGAVASSEPSIAAAIIENNGKQETYGIGDKITGTRATLESVFNDRVLIKQSGRLETLMLEGFKYGQSNSNSPAVPKRINSRVKPDASNKANIVDQRNNKSLSQSASRLKADINNDPGRITDYLRISPKRVQGKVTGYRLMPGKNAEFFQASGLKSGDVAIQMNGLDLTQPSEAAQALQALKQEQELSLLINRNDEMIEILFSIN